MIASSDTALQQCSFSEPIFITLIFSNSACFLIFYVIGKVYQFWLSIIFDSFTIFATFYFRIAGFISLSIRADLPGINTCYYTILANEQQHHQHQLGFIQYSLFQEYQKYHIIIFIDFF